MQEKNIMSKNESCKHDTNASIFINIFYFSKYDFRKYRVRWQKLREKKLKEQEEKKEKQLLEAAKATAGENVPLITTVSSGREIVDMYLKHPANESSEDEEGTEMVAGDEEREQNEEGSFKSFLEKHQTQSNKRNTSQEPSSSKDT